MWWRMQVASRLSSGWKKPRQGDEYDQGDACVGRKVFVEMFGEGTYCTTNCNRSHVRLVRMVLLFSVCAEKTVVIYPGTVKEFKKKQSKLFSSTHTIDFDDPALLTKELTLRRKGNQAKGDAEPTENSHHRRWLIKKSAEELAADSKEAAAAAAASAIDPVRVRFQIIGNARI